MRRYSNCSLARSSLCIEQRVYKSKLFNDYSIFSTEQRVFIYDQYLLTQSASQVRRLFVTRFPGLKIHHVQQFIICKTNFR